jgi:hypothetical protein
MTPEAGEVLLGEIAPRLRSAIPRCVQPVGAEDSEELVQDAIVVAAKMLENVERAGKKVTPGSIAYYTILHMKSGRRSQGASRADVMACGTQLDRLSAVMSLDEEVDFDPMSDEPITLHELLATEGEDPAMAGGRNVDWELFIASHDHRYGVIVKGMIEGRTARSMADDNGRGFSRIFPLMNKLADDLREFMGEQAIRDSAKIPGWRGNLVVDRERAACQADRRRW